MEYERTLEEARQDVRANMAAGTVCPCCDRIVKLYKRKLHANMALSLMRIYQASTAEKRKHALNYLPFIHVKEYLRINRCHNSNDWTLLGHWGLIEEQYWNDTEQKRSGYWRITPKGMNFLQGKMNVAKCIYLLNTCW